MLNIVSDWRDRSTSNSDRRERLLKSKIQRVEGCNDDLRLNGMFKLVRVTHNPQHTTTLLPILPPMAEFVLIAAGTPLLYLCLRDNNQVFEPEDKVYTERVLPPAMLRLAGSGVLAVRHVF